MNKWIKIALGVSGTIILGAIGSGLWERVLSKFFDFLVNSSIQGINLIFTSYKDDIYLNASLGFHEAYSLSLYSFFISLLPLTYMWLLQKHPVEIERKRGNNKTKEFIRSQNGYRCLQGLTLTVIVFSAFSTAKIRYTNEIVTFSMRSLDIVEPYLAANEFTKLRSHFHQVRSTEEFMVFYNEISFKAKENSLKLPKFSPL